MTELISLLRSLEFRLYHKSSSFSSEKKCVALERAAFKENLKGHSDDACVCPGVVLHHVLFIRNILRNIVLTQTVLEADVGEKSSSIRNTPHLKARQECIMIICGVFVKQTFFSMRTTTHVLHITT